jgi:hypothetical protein
MSGKLAVATRAGLFWPDAPDAVAFSGREVNALAHGLDGTLWAIVGRQELWRRSQEWALVTRSEDLTLNCVLPLASEVFVGASEAHLLRLANGTLEMVKGVEEAEGRTEWYTPWGGPPDIRSLSSNGSVYAGVHVGGILRLQQDGSWSQTIDIHSDVHEVRALPDGFVLAATARGLAVSRDAGGNWEFQDSGLHATYCRAVTTCENTVLVSASVGPHGGRAALYRRALEPPEPLEKCVDGLPEWFGDNINTGCVAGFDRTVAFGTSDGRVFLSEDCGGRWAVLADGLPEVLHVSFVE